MDATGIAVPRATSGTTAAAGAAADRRRNLG